MNLQRRDVYDTPENEIPALIKHAFISAEDKNFYDHPYYDMRGILAALVDAVQSRKANKGSINDNTASNEEFLLDRSRRTRER